MGEFLGALINFFSEIYKADKRPEARKLTIGCFVVVLIVVIVIAVIFSIGNE